MLSVQPEFIELGDFESEADFDEKAAQARTNAFGGAIIYGVITVLCTIAYQYHLRKTPIKLGKTKQINDCPDDIIPLSSNSHNDILQLN